MKATLRYITSIAAVVALFALTGCNTVSTSVTQQIGGPKFPPSDPTKVQILRTEPTRPHVRLGEVTAEPATESVDVTVIEAALQKAAAKLGADAAVVVADRTQVTGAYVTGSLVGTIRGHHPGTGRRRRSHQIPVSFVFHPSTLLNHNQRL